jgi:hypothetical protein
MAPGYRLCGPAFSACQSDSGAQDVRCARWESHSVAFRADVDHSPIGRSNYDVAESPYAVYSSRGQ